MFESAVRTAAVAGSTVPVVAILKRLEYVIAAELRRNDGGNGLLLDGACCRTPVAGDGVAVVASFRSIERAVAAGKEFGEFELACVAATIAGNGVAVVADFIVFHVIIATELRRVGSGVGI